MKSYSVLLSLLLLTPGVDVNSQTTVDPRTRIFFECAGGGLVGTNLCYEVKERVRKSSTLTVADTEKDTFAKVRLHCADASSTPGDAISVAALMTLLPSDSYLHDQVLWVGANRVEFAATTIVAGLDQYLEQLFKDAARSRLATPPR